MCIYIYIYSVAALQQQKGQLNLSTSSSNCALKVFACSNKSTDGSAYCCVVYQIIVQFVTYDIPPLIRTSPQSESPLWAGILL